MAAVEVQTRRRQLLMILTPLLTLLHLHNELDCTEECSYFGRFDLALEMKCEYPLEVLVLVVKMMMLSQLTLVSVEGGEAL